jgi:hypothetical protein
LIRLENEAIPLIVKLAEDNHKPELIRSCAWSVLGQIGTLESLNTLVFHLMTTWGATRRNILRVLVKLPSETSEEVSDLIGRSGLETLINQELMLIGQIYAGLTDLTVEAVAGREADLLRRALRDLQDDVIERLFLLMRLLYPSSTIQAAIFNLQSASSDNMARGLEILDNTLDIPSKRALLIILDRRSDLEKLQSLAEIVNYQPMSPSQRVRHLLELRHFLSDWALACCFHLSRQCYWSLTATQTLSCLRHPTGFVREAVLMYMRVASPLALTDLLHLLKDDSDRLVNAQVQEIMALMHSPNRTPSSVESERNGSKHRAYQPGFEPFG